MSTAIDVVKSRCTLNRSKGVIGFTTLRIIVSYQFQLAVESGK